MEWTIPGTTLTGRRDRPDIVEDQIRAMFRTGGLVRSQVAAATGLESYAVQNWVKRGFLSAPVGKRYTCRQFCRIVIINMLRSTLPMEQICGLLSFVNGQLDDESDDAIDDSELYFAFVRAASAYDGRMEDRDALRQCVRQSLADYREPFPGAKHRVEQVLVVMLTAWASAMLRKNAEDMVSNLDLS